MTNKPSGMTLGTAALIVGTTLAMVAIWLAL